jgi:hypothetical protein
LINSNYRSKNNNENKSIFYNVIGVNNKELVIRNNDMYESTVGLKISLQTRNLTIPFCNSHLFSQIIGHLLGDGGLALS